MGCVSGVRKGWEERGKRLKPSASGSPIRIMGSHVVLLSAFRLACRMKRSCRVWTYLGDPAPHGMTTGGISSDVMMGELTVEAVFCTQDKA